MDQKELFKDNLRDTHWLGQVIDNQDPEKLGRCKIRVFGKFDLLEEDDIPWSIPMFAHGQYMIPKVDDIIAVYFDNGNIYTPVYKYNATLSTGVQDKLNDLSDPTDLITLAYDTEKGVKVYWKKGDGIIIERLTTDTNSDVELITLLSNNTSGSNSGNPEPAVLGDKNKEVLDSIYDALTQITKEVGNIAKDTSILNAAGVTAAATPLFSAAPLSAPIAQLNSTALQALKNIADKVADVKPKIEPTKSKNIKLN